MIRIEILNVEDLGSNPVVLTAITTADGNKVYKDKDGNEVNVLEGKSNDCYDVELLNGVYLKSYHDGRYITYGDESESWAEVSEVEYDEDGEIVGCCLLGYTRI